MTQKKSQQICGHLQVFFLLFIASNRSQSPGPTLVPGVFSANIIFTQLNSIWPELGTAQPELAKTSNHKPKPKNKGQGTWVGPGIHDHTLAIKSRKKHMSTVIYIFLQVGSKKGGILKISILGPPEVVEYHCMENNGQLRLQLPPGVVHAGCLDQNP